MGDGEWGSSEPPLDPPPLILFTLPLFFSIAPSQSCGPFRVYSDENYTMFETLSITITTWPIVLKDIVMFLGTVGFLIPVIIILW